MAHLINRAGGLFIWAATACRFILGAPLFLDRRLSLLLGNEKVGRSPEEDLDSIYTSILSQSLKRDYCEEEYDYVSTLFKRIFGAIVLVFEPLSMDPLCRLIDLPRITVNHVIGDLHSVLEIPDSDTRPIRILHLSFRDFILSERRCQDSRIRVDRAQVHHKLHMGCLRCMSQTLRKDICSLQLPGISLAEIGKGVVEKAIAPDVQYACRHWVSHLQQSGIMLCDNDNVHTFLLDHFLHWLEALSLMGVLPESIHAIRTLESIISVSGNPFSPRYMANIM